MSGRASEGVRRNMKAAPASNGERETVVPLLRSQLDTARFGCEDEAFSSFVLATKPFSTFVLATKADTCRTRESSSERIKIGRASEDLRAGMLNGHFNFKIMSKNLFLIFHFFKHFGKRGQTPQMQCT